MKAKTKRPNKLNKLWKFLNQVPGQKHQHVGGKDREYFTSNLAALLRAGVSAKEALASLRETSQSEGLNKVLDNMQSDIDEGIPLWQALERSQLMSRQSLILVRIGEQSGRLAENLRLAAKHEAKQRAFKGKVRSALMYPTFVLVTTFVVGTGVAWFLLPRLATTFTQVGLPLPLVSRVVLGFGIFLSNYGIFFFSGIAAIIVALIIGYRALPSVQRFVRECMFYIPGVGGLLQEVEIARFSYLLGSLLETAMPISEALLLLQGATTAPRYQAFYTYLMRAFEEGYNFKTIFKKYKYSKRVLPPAVQQMVISGEYSGVLAQTLLDVNTTYEEKVELSVQNLEVMIEPILLVIVWVGVLIIAIAVILPIYSLVGGLNAVH